MGEVVRGIDTDNYDGQVPVAHFQRLYDLYGVRFNIIGLEARMPYAQDQKLACEAAGITVDVAYKFLYGTHDDLERLKEAAGFGLPIAVDIEAELDLGIQANVQRMHEAKNLLIAEGRFWGWYSSQYFWEIKTGNTMDFAGDYCWSASYPFLRNPPPPTYMPDFNNFPVFGGLTPQVWQYSNACYEDVGKPWAFDLNAYEYADAPVPPQPPVRTWIYGDENAGLERRGNQQFWWNNRVETDILGDIDGLYPGQHWHNVGGVFIQTAQ